MKEKLSLDYEKEWESIFGKMEPFMRDNGGKTTFKALEPYISVMETSIEEASQRINQTEEGNYVILME
jgi:hypothetical protein